MLFHAIAQVSHSFALLLLLLLSSPRLPCPFLVRSCDLCPPHLPDVSPFRPQPIGRSRDGPWGVACSHRSRNGIGQPDDDDPGGATVRRLPLDGAQGWRHHLRAVPALSRQGAARRRRRRRHRVRDERAGQPQRDQGPAGLRACAPPAQPLADAPLLHLHRRLRRSREGGPRRRQGGQGPALRPRAQPTHRRRRLGRAQAKGERGAAAPRHRGGQAHPAVQGAPARSRRGRVRPGRGHLHHQSDVHQPDAEADQRHRRNPPHREAAPRALGGRAALLQGRGCLQAQQGGQAGIRGAVRFQDLGRQPAGGRSRAVFGDRQRARPHAVAGRLASARRVHRRLGCRVRGCRRAGAAAAARDGQAAPPRVRLCRAAAIPGWQLRLPGHAQDQPVQGHQGSGRPLARRRCAGCGAARRAHLVGEAGRPRADPRADLLHALAPPAVRPLPLHQRGLR